MTAEGGGGDGGGGWGMIGGRVRLSGRFKSRRVGNDSSSFGERAWGMITAGEGVREGVARGMTTPGARGPGPLGRAGGRAGGRGGGWPVADSNQGHGTGVGQGSDPVGSGQVTQSPPCLDSRNAISSLRGFSFWRSTPVEQHSN